MGNRLCFIGLIRISRKWDLINKLLFKIHEIELFNDRLINMIYASHKPSAKFTTTKKFITFSFALSWKLIYDFPASRADHNSPSPITKALSRLAINCILVKSPATSTQKFIEKFTHQQPTEQIELPFHPPKATPPHIPTWWQCHYFARNSIINFNYNSTNFPRQDSWPPPPFAVNPLFLVNQKPGVLPEKSGFGKSAPHSDLWRGLSRKKCETK